MAADRMRQVNELVHKTVGNIIARDVDLPLGTFVTITHVSTSKDLEHASVFVTVLPDGKRVSTIKALQSKRGVIQRLFAKQIRLRRTPKLNFLFDEQEIKAQHVYDVLDQAPIEE